MISNDSGCMGAALSRGKKGESTVDIYSRFPFWFCPKFAKLSENPSLLPFDQHFLLSLVAPRYLLVGSAEEDLWAGPENEFLSCVATSEVYHLFGVKGLVYKDEIPTAKSVSGDGEILYQIRKGGHFCSREDRNTYIDIILSKIKKST